MTLYVPDLCDEETMQRALEDSERLRDELEMGSKLTWDDK